jgi:peptidoglycan/LPS O-acetylase OafA/YrhL
MGRRLERIPSLDGLRAVSIALVVFSHLIGNLGVPVFVFGNLGVRIFFVISGYLITSILLEEMTRTSTLNLKKFYFRRTLRIFPAYYFFLLAIFILTLLGVYHIPNSDFLIPSFYLSNYLTPLPWEIGHTWSLSVEEQFYLLFPGILLVLGITKTRELLIYIILLIPFVRLFHLIVWQINEEANIPFWFTFSFHTNMDTLASGCLLAVVKDSLHNNKLHNAFLRSPGAMIVVASIVFVTVFYFSNFAMFYSFVGLTILNFSIALGLDWLITNPETGIGRLLNSPPFVFIGVMSYSIYLWQQPFLKYSDEQWWTRPPYNLILLISCSLFSYYIIEKTFLHLRKNWEKNIFIKTENMIAKTEEPA